MALSVITPVRRMGEKMERIGTGDFTEPVEVENVDELGELADGLNETSRELARLQEATVVAERERTLHERITQVTTAQEEERRRISRELHDGLGPSLAAVGNRIRACQQTMRTDPEASERELGEIANSLKSHIQEVRELVYGLRPLALDQLGLNGALKQHVERFGKETGLETSLTVSGEVALDSLAEVTIMRVVQECLNNAQKHADASRVDVRLRVVETGLELTVEDDGRGFALTEVQEDAQQRGMGLMSMRERAELLNGSLSVGDSPRGGGKVVLHVPVEEQQVGAR